MTTINSGLNKEIEQMFLDNQKENFFPFAIFNVSSKKDIEDIEDFESVIDKTIYYYKGKEMTGDNPVRIYRYANPEVKNSVSFILLSKIYHDGSSIIDVKKTAIGDFLESHVTKITSLLKGHDINLVRLNKGLILNTPANIAIISGLNKNKNAIITVKTTFNDNVLKVLGGGPKDLDTEKLASLVMLSGYKIVGLYGVALHDEDLVENFIDSFYARVSMKIQCLSLLYIVKDGENLLFIALDKTEGLVTSEVGRALSEIVKEIKSNTLNDFTDTKRIKFDPYEIDIINEPPKSYEDIELLTAKPLSFYLIQERFSGYPV